MTRGARPKPARGVLDGCRAAASAALLIAIVSAPLGDAARYGFAVGFGAWLLAWLLVGNRGWRALALNRPPGSFALIFVLAALLVVPLQRAAFLVFVALAAQVLG